MWKDVHGVFLKVRHISEIFNSFPQAHFSNACLLACHVPGAGSTAVNYTGSIILKKRKEIKLQTEKRVCLEKKCFISKAMIELLTVGILAREEVARKVEDLASVSGCSQWLHLLQ